MRDNGVWEKLGFFYMYTKRKEEKTSSVCPLLLCFRTGNKECLHRYNSRCSLL